MSNVSKGIKILAFGGLGEVGKNTYCFESDNSIILIDAGVKFPEANLPGIDYVIPDYSYLKYNQSKFKALFITHGHEDHIGGIPFLIQHLHVPVIYAPKLAAELIRHKLELMRIHENVNIIIYDANSKIDINNHEFDVSFFRVTHSIPDAYGIIIDTKEGRIAATGDFKIDLTPVGEDIEIKKIAKFGSEGVDLLLSDSTNAEIEGYTPSESNVYQSINDVFRFAYGRVIVSTFSSNISRIQQVATAAYSFNRKILIVGRSMEFAISTSRKFGYIKIPDSAIIEADEISKYKNNEICIICTGSQGETNAALSKIAWGEHKTIHIIPGDTIVFSSSPIPGNGLSIERIINKLTKAGAKVLTNGSFSLHSSGHPSKQELRLMLKLFSPKYFMPVHGEYRMLKLHGDLAVTTGVRHDHIFILDNGQSIYLKDYVVSKGDNLNLEDVFLEGNSLIGISQKTINDRKQIKLDGTIIVTTTIDNGKLLNNPIVDTKGFVINNLDKFINNLTKRIILSLNHNLNYDNERLKIIVIKSAKDYLKELNMDRDPLVLPIFIRL